MAFDLFEFGSMVILYLLVNCGLYGRIVSYLIATTTCSLNQFAPELCITSIPYYISCKYDPLIPYGNFQPESSVMLS